MPNTTYTTAAEFYADPFGGTGQLIVNHPEKRTWVRCDDNGVPVEECTVHYIDPIIEANKASFNDSQGKRWGDGKIVASIPMDLYHRTILPMKKAGDDRGLKAWLDNSDNRAFRTFEGKV